MLGVQRLQFHFGDEEGDRVLLLLVFDVYLLDLVAPAVGVSVVVAVLYLLVLIVRSRNFFLVFTDERSLNRLFGVVALETYLDLFGTVDFFEAEVFGRACGYQHFTRLG